MLDEWIRGNGSEEKSHTSWMTGPKGRWLLVIVICLGLLALLWPGSRSQPSPAQGKPQIADQNDSGRIKEKMQAELEFILSQIAGAGTVEVSLTLSSEGQRSYVTNDRNERREIEENEGGSGKRQTLEETFTRDLAVSSGNPLLVEEKSPEVLGVLVVADGAGDPRIQERLTQATATLLDISAHKVQVLPREGGTL